MDEELVKQVINDVSNAVSDSLKKSKQLLNETINSTIYSGKKPKQYERTYTFANAWQLGEKEKKRDSVSQSLDYDYSIMIYDGNDNVHGNGSIDRRPIMASILENKKYNNINSDFGGALNVSSNEKQNYWEKFKHELDTKIYNYLDEDLSKYGITRR